MELATYLIYSIYIFRLYEHCYNFLIRNLCSAQLWWWRWWYFSLLLCVSGRLAKTASQTGEVLLNGHRKTNLSYGIAVWTLILSLSLSLSLCVSVEKASALAFCSEIGLSLRTHLLHICSGILLRNWTLSHISLPQRTHLFHIWFVFLHRNWAFSLREPIFTSF